MRPEFITVGTIVNAHGIRGEVKVNPAGFDPEFIADFKTMYIAGQPVKVKAARVHKSTVLLALPGVDTMDDALALKGRAVSIRRTDARLPKGEYFDQELEGCAVVDDATGEELGKLDIRHLKVVYSTEDARTPAPVPGETPDEGRRSIPGSVSFVPGAAGPPGCGRR